MTVLQTMTEKCRGIRPALIVMGHIPQFTLCILFLAAPDVIRIFVYAKVNSHDIVVC